MGKKRNLAILGSTGSIGVQALEVVRSHPEEFQVEVLIAGGNYELLIEQSLEFKPSVAVIGNQDHHPKVFAALGSEGIRGVKYAMVGMVSLTLMNIVLNIFLIPIFSLYGGVLASIITYSAFIAYFKRMNKQFILERIRHST